jgi:3-oxoacyl-[acyl-carrier protein] reductase
VSGIAIVTGGAGALGQSIVRDLVARQCRTVIAYRSNGDSAQRLQNELGPELTHLVKADLADRAAAEEIVASTVQRFGAPTILVNNAGAMTESLVQDMPDRVWDELIDLNLSSAFRLSRAVIPGMMSAGSGRIVNISSQAAYRGSIGRAHYAAAKAGLLGLTFSLAKELGPSAITVNVVVPGRIESEMVSSRMGGKVDQWLEATPLGRLGTPSELASAVGYLTSPEASYITGAVLQVGGGLVMG